MPGLPAPPNTLTGPYALAAYALVVVAWLFYGTARRRLQIISSVLKDVPEHERATLLAREYNVTPKAGVSAEQWLRARKQTFLFMAFALTVLLVVGLAILESINSDRWMGHVEEL